MRSFLAIISFQLVLFVATEVTGQISVSPTTLYIHDDINIGSLLVANGLDAEREISVSFDFGYPSSDSLGNLVMVYNDTLSEVRYGFGNRLRVFPRKFRLKPGSQQIVRVQILPMKSRPDGAFWTRMVIKSSEAKNLFDNNPAAGELSTHINYIFKQNIALFYLKGEVTTGLVPGEVNISVNDGKISVISELKSSGNAPFNGCVSAKLFDNEGNMISSRQRTLVVYFEVLNRLEMVLPERDLSPGSYMLEFLYETKRSDIPAADLVQSEPVNYKFPFMIE